MWYTHARSKVETRLELIDKTVFVRDCCKHESYHLLFQSTKYIAHYCWWKFFSHENFLLPNSHTHAHIYYLSDSSFATSVFVCIPKWIFCGYWIQIFLSRCQFKYWSETIKSHKFSQLRIFYPFSHRKRKKVILQLLKSFNYKTTTICLFNTLENFHDIFSWKFPSFFFIANCCTNWLSVIFSLVGPLAKPLTNYLLFSSLQQLRRKIISIIHG
jgi:hypothetical protein